MLTLLFKRSIISPLIWGCRHTTHSYFTQTLLCCWCWERLHHYDCVVCVRCVQTETWVKKVSLEIVSYSLECSSQNCIVSIMYFWHRNFRNSENFHVGNTTLLLYTDSFMILVVTSTKCPHVSDIHANRGVWIWQKN